MVPPSRLMGLLEQVGVSEALLHYPPSDKGSLARLLHTLLQIKGLQLDSFIILLQIKGL